MAQSSLLKIRVSGQSAKQVEYAAVKFARAFPLGRVDGNLVSGSSGDFLAWVLFVLEEGEA